tara:strand:+ start:431 stop:598 length:168 start_codon:yes stop_codon:yes gene_type:complete
LGRISKRAQPWGIGITIIIANLHAFWLINNPDLTDLEFAAGIDQSQQPPKLLRQH